MLQTFSITVSGKVQGVFYRQRTKERALELGITGIVKNEEDGTVHITATGTSKQLDQLVQWCKQGPPRAIVSSVEVHIQDPRAFSGFSIEK